MTKCIVIGEEATKKKSKHIEFVKAVTGRMSDVKYQTSVSEPHHFEYVELICPAFNSSFYDMMFAYDDNRKKGTIFLGHWNDGFVEE